MKVIMEVNEGVTYLGNRSVSEAEEEIKRERFEESDRMGVG